MNDDNYSGDLHAWIEPEIEARVVALILGEASDFEAEELERLMDERPEIRVFKRRLESVHGLLGTALVPQDEDEWQLAPERKAELLEALELADPPEEVPVLNAAESGARERRIRRAGRRVVWSAAACLAITLFLVALLARPKLGADFLATKRESDEKGAALQKKILSQEEHSQMFSDLDAGLAMEIAPVTGDSVNVSDGQFADDRSVRHALAKLHATVEDAEERFEGRESRAKYYDRGRRDLSDGQSQPQELIEERNRELSELQFRADSQSNSYSFNGALLGDLKKESAAKSGRPTGGAHPLLPPITPAPKSSPQPSPEPAPALAEIEPTAEAEWAGEAKLERSVSSNGVVDGRVPARQANRGGRGPVAKKPAQPSTRRRHKEAAGLGTEEEQLSKHLAARDDTRSGEASPSDGFATTPGTPTAEKGNNLSFGDRRKSDEEAEEGPQLGRPMEAREKLAEKNEGLSSDLGGLKTGKSPGDVRLWMEHKGAKKQGAGQGQGQGQAGLSLADEGYLAGGGSGDRPGGEASGLERDELFDSEPKPATGYAGKNLGSDAELARRVSGPVQITGGGFASKAEGEDSPGSDGITVRGVVRDGKANKVAPGFKAPTSVTKEPSQPVEELLLRESTFAEAQEAPAEGNVVTAPVLPNEPSDPAGETKFGRKVLNATKRFQNFALPGESGFGGGGGAKVASDPAPDRAAGPADEGNFELAESDVDFGGKLDQSGAGDGGEKKWAFQKDTAKDRLSRGFGEVADFYAESLGEEAELDLEDQSVELGQSVQSATPGPGRPKSVLRSGQGRGEVSNQRTEEVRYSVDQKDKNGDLATTLEVEVMEDEVKTVSGEAIRPENKSAMESRRWDVPLEAWKKIKAGQASSEGKLNARDLLEGDAESEVATPAVAALRDYGIEFPPGATVTYHDATGTFVAENTQANLGLIDSVVKKSLKQLNRERAALKSFEKRAADEPYSTFSLNVSDVSFKLAKAALARGEWPLADQVRTEEFVNAFDYGDSAPNQEERVACKVEQAAHPFLQQRNLMRVSMRTAALGRSANTPLRLTVLLDNSGSMDRADRVESVRSAFQLLAAQLGAQDQVTLVSFARTARLLADRVAGDKAGKLAEDVEATPSEGGTNLELALELGMEKAKEQFFEGGQNRVILLTDGAANLGNAKPSDLARLVASMRQQGIAFDACGVGAEGLNDDILESLTRKGDGRYYFLDRPEDADAGFARQIAGALRPAARNVKVQVNFNPRRVGHYKLYGFEKHRLKKEDFRNDSVDAAELAAEEAGNAIYQIELLPDGSGEVGTVSVRFQDMATGQMVERKWTIPYESQAPRVEDATASLRLASGAALLGEKLKGSLIGEAVEMPRLGKLINSLPADYPSDERVKDLVQMANKVRELGGK